MKKSKTSTYTKQTKQQIKRFSQTALQILLMVSIMIASPTNTQCAESDAYKQPISSMPSSGTSITSECMGDVSYAPTVPDKNNMDANTVTSKDYFSPSKLNSVGPTNTKWMIWDHVGIKDQAFTGERHIVRRDSGVQWFGYYAPPYNDIMLRDFSSMNRSGSFKINIKQAPVRADWHTINGSGLVFGAYFSGKAPTSDGEMLTVGESSQAVNDSGEGYPKSDAVGNFSGFAFVATNETNEVRYYQNVNMQAFCDGTAPYTIMQAEKKSCNSQSLTVTYEDSTKTYSFKLGNKTWGKSMKVGETLTGSSDGTGVVAPAYAQRNSEGDILNTPTTIVVPAPGRFSGAMVDYEQHCCDSLSSVYMFNYTYNDQNYF